MKSQLVRYAGRLALIFLLARATQALGQEDPASLRAKALKVLAPLPLKAPGTELDTPARISLGRKLYFEKRLSENQSQACNSCHLVDAGRAGVDNEATSVGAFGKHGGRNAPTTLNAALEFSQFWDGRAADLTGQAKGPILNPIEMAMPSEAEVVARLNADRGYPALFAKAFPEAATPVSYENLARAIAAYERTLITRDRFDDFLKGRDTALTHAELKGLSTFLSAGCTSCHNGPLLGGNSYQKVGLVKPYENQADEGRAAVTKDPDDKMKFKVPTLRNIAATHPYFHDGRARTLNQAVRKMAEMQLGLTLDADQEAGLVAFLGALTGRGIHAAHPAADQPPGGR